MGGSVSYIPKPGALAPKAPAAAGPPAVVRVEKIELETKEVWFDAATSTVFKMMVSSYAQQHGHDPDAEMMLDWASNLYSLSNKAANGSDGGVRVKVRMRR